MTSFTLSYFDQKKNKTHDFSFTDNPYINYENRVIISILKKNDFSNLKIKKENNEYELSECFVVKAEVVLNEKIDLFFVFDIKNQDSQFLTSEFTSIKEDAKHQNFRFISEKLFFVLDRVKNLNPIFCYSLQYIDITPKESPLAEICDSISLIMPSSDYSSEHINHINSGINNNVARYNLLCSALVFISFFAFVFSLFFKNFIWILAILFFFVSIVLIISPFRNGLINKGDYVFQLSKKNYYKCNLFGVCIGAVIAAPLSFIFFSKYLLECLFSLFLGLLLSFIFYVALIYIFNRIVKKRRKDLFFDITKDYSDDEKDYFEATI